MLGLAACANGSNKENNTKKENTMKTIALTKADFLTKVANYETNPTEWKYLGDKPALIDFYASWCGPCKALAPVLEELAAEYGDSIYIYKVNTEEEQELAAAFGIRSCLLVEQYLVDGLLERRLGQGTLCDLGLAAGGDEKQRRDRADLTVCPVGAITQSGFGLPVIDPEKCIECGKCVGHV